MQRSWKKDSALRAGIFKAWRVYRPMTLFLPKIKEGCQGQPRTKLHQLRQYFLGLSLDWAPSFRNPLRCLFLLQGDLVFFFNVDLLIYCDCTSRVR
jgi:hypothetical protein